MSNEPEEKKPEIPATAVLIGGVGIGVMVFLGIGMFVMLFEQRATTYSLATTTTPEAFVSAALLRNGRPFAPDADTPRATPATLSLNELPSFMTGSGSKWSNPLAEEFKGVGAGMPFFPHRASTAHKNLDPSAFDSSAVCSACHTEIHKQWSESVMSKSWVDPIYRAMLKRASVATNGSVDNFCTGCHSPVGLTTGQINSDVSREPIEVAVKQNRVLPGVDCESCHNISALTGMDNGAYVMTPRNNPEGMPQKYGPRKDAESPYHKTAFSELHTRSEFCSACHNVTHPFSHAPIERTFDEWQESSYNFNDKNCQSCHMPGFKGKSALTGKDREDVAAHTFTGGNLTLLNHFGLTAAAERSREMLKKAGKIQIVDTPQSIVAGRTARIKVKVSNVGAGHKLPTGFPEGREVWIDFQVKAQDGTELYRSGRVVEGRTEKGTRNFKVHLGDAEDNEVELEVWKVTHIISDNRILPGGYSIVEYNVPIPDNAAGPVTIHASLKYWPFSQSTVDELLGPGAMKVEVVDMAEDSQTVDLTGRPPTVALSAARDGPNGSPTAASIP